METSKWDGRGKVLLLLTNGGKGMVMCLGYSLSGFYTYCTEF